MAKDHHKEECGDHESNGGHESHCDRHSRHTESRRSSTKSFSESIYRPNFFRQRSSSFNNYLYHQSMGLDEEEEEKTTEENKIHIRVHRRKSVGYNMKLATAPTNGISINRTGAAPTAIIQTDSDKKKNELIISIPVLIEEADNISVNKDIIIKDCFDQEPPPYDDQPVMQSSWNVLKQMIIPFMIAGIGSVGAGIVLNDVQDSDSFKAIPQLLIMVPSFLGLIGNIETTLASRLSTHSNLGTLDEFDKLKSMVTANSAVVLCQSATVGLFAAFASLAMYYMTGASDKMADDLTIAKLILLLCASSVATSIVANTLLATAITSVIVISRKIGVNPGIHSSTLLRYRLLIIRYH